MKVGNIIQNQKLETIEPGATIISALRKMNGRKIHSLLVFEGNHFKGIITMTDIANAFGKNKIFVRHIMTPQEKIVSVKDGDGLQKCRTLFLKKKFHHLVVTNEKGEVKGVISNTDLMLAEDEASHDVAIVVDELPPG